MGDTAQRDPGTDDVAVNEVVLRGRVSADPEERTMPSGDPVVTWRLVVARAPARRRSRVRVDTIDCTAWSSATRRAALRLHAGDQAQVSGALRRHFWRGPGGASSRVDVEVSSVRRLRPRPVQPVEGSEPVVE
jgi:single-strand DNA-binding protein